MKIEDGEHFSDQLNIYLFFLIWQKLKTKKLVIIGPVLTVFVDISRSLVVVFLWGDEKKMYHGSVPNHDSWYASFLALVIELSARVAVCRVVT